MSDVMIRVENLSKQYRLGEVGTGTLSHDLNRWWAQLRGKEDPFLKIGESNDRTTKGNSDYVWALRDINFDVKQGEVLGIIGRNGAGKSTLLKILSKTTTPTTGSVKIKGRVASLLEVGTGFHPEMTGRENIFLNGAILGMTKREIKTKFDEIVDFAGVERYVDTPVKRYSSGMYVRLAFAVAAHLEPEILIVDEVLAVGDAEFQKKCLGKMEDVSKKEGRTVMFVTHNMGVIAQLCLNTLVLNKGRIFFVGDSNSALQKYGQLERELLQNYVNSDAGEFVISKVEVENDGGGCSFKFSEEVVVEIDINLPRNLSGLHLGVAVNDRWKRKLFTTVKAIFKKSNSTEEKFYVSLPAKLLLNGSYSLDVSSFIPNSISYSYIKDVCPFEVEDHASEMSVFGSADVGTIFVNCKWS